VVAAVSTGGRAFAIGVYLFDYCVPWQTILFALTSYFFILRGGFLIVGGIHALVKHVVP
jgi:hypothetical protein